MLYLTEYKSREALREFKKKKYDAFLLCIPSGNSANKIMCTAPPVLTSWAAFEVKLQKKKTVNIIFFSARITEKCLISTVKAVFSNFVCPVRGFSLFSDARFVHKLMGQ